MLTPRQATLVALAALVPTTAYAVWSPEVTPYMALVNVVIMATAFFLMMGPSDNGAHAT